VLESPRLADTRGTGKVCTLMLSERPTPAVDDPPITEESLAMASTPDGTPSDRKLVLVAGSGRSGTSLMAGILRHMGLHVPEPEVVADHTNPKGFGEPQWVVEFHDLLLRRVNVHPGDARPTAWFDAGRAGSREWNRSDLATWLEGQFAVSDTLVVKDPRISWFLGLWRVAAVRNGASTATITMLRHPAEVVGSKNTYYGGKFGDTSRLAGWTNMMLFTERATRGSARSFVRYHDLLSDWTSTVVRVGEELDLDHVRNAGTRVMQEIHQFVDPQLHRVRASWDDLNVPSGLRDIADETWQQLNSLVEPSDDPEQVAKTYATLDELRRAYGELYAQAEALASSSIDAAGPAFMRATREQRALEAEEHSRRAFEESSAMRKLYLRVRGLVGRVLRRIDRIGEPKGV
jgi:hypothetical protein